MRIYAYQSYRTFIRDAIEGAKRVNTGMNYSQLAKAVGVQKSYLSQVLAGKCHLNSDQLFKAAKCLGLDLEESEFLILLLEQEKTTIEERRLFLNARREFFAKNKAAG